MQSLLNDARFAVQAVVTQPDRPAGRKQIPEAPPVKKLAVAHTIPVFQPEKLRDVSPKSLGLKPDFFIVAEFGQLIPEHWRTFPIIDTINVHPSLLPKYRGATPIQTALLNGDAATGVTIMQLEPTMDTGPIVSAVKMIIDPDDVYEDVEQKLAALAGPLLSDSLAQLAKKKITPVPQNHAEATHCRKLTRDSGRIDWQRSAPEIYNQYRALHRWPGVWTTWNNLRVKLLAIKPSATAAAPGLVVWQNKSLIIGTGTGSIEVTRLQLEGRSAMDAAVFLSGAADFIGAELH